MLLMERLVVQSRLNLLPGRSCINPRRERIDVNALQTGRGRSKSICLCAPASQALTLNKDVGNNSTRAKVSKVVQQNFTWIQHQEPFCRLPASACMALAEAVQVEVLSDRDKLLRSDQRITDLIIVRDGQLCGSEPQKSDYGAFCLLKLHETTQHILQMTLAPALCPSHCHWGIICAVMQRSACSVQA